MPTERSSRRRWRALGWLVAVAALGSGLAPPVGAQLPPPPQLPPGVRPVLPPAPAGPRAAGAALPAGTVPFFETVLRLTVDGLAAGTHVTLDQLSSSCFTLKPRVAYAPDLVGPDGRAQLTRQGWATRSGACHVAGRVASTAPGARASDLDFGAVSVAEPATYAVRHTWRLRDRLGFKFITGTGTCEGTSLGPLHSFPVGVHESDEDLSLVIHGGPIGTDCQFGSKAWHLPAGVMLVSTTWAIARQGTCGAVGPLGGGATPLLAFTTPNLNRGAAAIVASQVAESPRPWYSLVSADQPVVTTDNVIMLEQNHTLASFLLPMWTRLQCGVAPHNEDRIRLTLTEIVFAGPPGLSFP